MREGAFTKPAGRTKKGNRGHQLLPRGYRGRRRTPERPDWPTRSLAGQRLLVNFPTWLATQVVSTYSTPGPARFKFI